LCVLIFLVKRTVDGLFVTRYTNVKLNELIGCVTVCNLQCCVTNLSNRHVIKICTSQFSHFSCHFHEENYNFMLVTNDCMSCKNKCLRFLIILALYEFVYVRVYVCHFVGFQRQCMLRRSDAVDLLDARWQCHETSPT